MSDQDTSLARGESRFPRTPWSAIVAMRAGETERCQTALNDLFSIYWRPVYKYIRVRWSKKNEEAKDLVQAYFANLCDKSLLNRIQATRGRFRTFLKMTVDSFVSNENRAGKAEKRGGGVPVISIDIDDEKQIEIADPNDAERVFNTEWMRTLMERAIEIMEQRYAAENKKIHFELFKRHDMRRDEQPKFSYKDSAKEFGLTYFDVVNYLSHARARFRETVMELVKETAPEDQVDDEVRQLFGASF